MADAHHRAAVAERAARSGGVVAREAFRANVAVETKANRNDFVTTADHDAQAQVVATVRQEFPDDAFLLEEQPRELPGADGPMGAPNTVDDVPVTGPVWIVDPIDGTSNFVRGLRTWTTSVAAVVDGQPVASATIAPAVDDAYTAGPESVTRNGEPIAVNERADPETFTVATTGWWVQADRAVFSNLTRTVVERFGDLRRIGSFQATLAHVAAGGFEAAIAPGPTLPWDTVAGVHMVRRAGGTVTDAHGDPWEPEADGLVASNGEAHDDVIGAVQSAREDV